MGFLMSRKILKGISLYCSFRNSALNSFFQIHKNQLNEIRTRNYVVSAQTDVETATDIPTIDNSEVEEYDFIIAGGGLVGTILAVALAKTENLRSRRILLLETANKTYEKGPKQEHVEKNDADDFSNRVFAISPGSKNILEKYKIWDNIWRYEDVMSMQVWDGLSDASISFNNPDFKSPVSYIVEHPVLMYAINKALSNEGSNVQVELGSYVTNCTIPNKNDEKSKASVLLKDGRKFSTKLLIGADGFNSRVRSSINSNYISFNYNRTAVVATLELSEPTENNTAWQRFLPTGGPIAVLPLSRKYSSLVWSTTPSHAKDLMKMSSENFVEAVNSALWKNYGRSIIVEKVQGVLTNLDLISKGPSFLPPSISNILDGSRATFPLGFGHSSFYINRRAVLIGDAAHKVHPLAGQGLNLGIGDVDCLQTIIEQSVGLGMDYGLPLVLKEYETKRQRHNLVIQSGIDFLHRLYSIDLSPVVALRTAGLSLVNSSEWLKKCIISQAAA